jgi:NAD(P)-dependent dehydrogenase (short-subunit alcohol dehydrogenase family)
MKTTTEYTAENFSFIMATNFESAYHFSQLSHPLLKASSAGNVVFVSSVCGVVSVNVGSIYAATKGTIIYLSLLLGEILIKSLNFHHFCNLTPPIRILGSIKRLKIFITFIPL